MSEALSDLAWVTGVAPTPSPAELLPAESNTSVPHTFPLVGMEFFGKAPLIFGVVKRPSCQCRRGPLGVLTVNIRMLICFQDPCQEKEDRKNKKTKSL